MLYQLSYTPVTWANRRPRTPAPAEIEKVDIVAATAGASRVWTITPPGPGGKEPQAVDHEAIVERIGRAERAIASLRGVAGDVAALLDAAAGVAAGGGTLLTCGNGGSAAHALHLAEELIGKYSRPRDPIPAICLNADPTALTCIANDFGYDEVFARQVRALARPGDAVVGISTSGGSANVLAALRAAREAGALALGLLGRGGGDALGLCDHAVVVPTDDAETVQEAHQVLVHLLVEGIEERATGA
jgi:D-sedoheptulose 7-phosphate isomerase